MSRAHRFDTSALPQSQRDTGVWAAGLLRALAREEVAGRRTQRLTEPGLSTWKRFHGRLTSRDFIELLFEDAAVLHPVPFERKRIDAPFDFAALPQAITDGWLASLGDIDFGDASPSYISDQAKLLGLPTRLARADLHALKAHHKVLELPGTGGQLAHHMASTQSGLSLKDNFTVACGSWQELTLAGIVGLDLGAPDSTFVEHIEVEALADPKHPLRKRSFDYVTGLHPDKGGAFRVDDQLAIWWSSAKILLV
jgi:hypothetical protein